MKKWTCKRADFCVPSCLFLLPALFAFPCPPRFYFLLLELYPKLPQNELLLKSFLIMRLVTQMNGALLKAHNVAQADSTFRCSLSELAFLSNNGFHPFLFCCQRLWPGLFKKSHSQKWMESVRIKVKVNLTEQENFKVRLSSLSVGPKLYRRSRRVSDLEFSAKGEGSFPHNGQSLCALRVTSMELLHGWGKQGWATAAHFCFTMEGRKLSNIWAACAPSDLWAPKSWRRKVVRYLLWTDGCWESIG